MIKQTKCWLCKSVKTEYKNKNYFNINFKKSCQYITPYNQKEYNKFTLNKVNFKEHLKKCMFHNL